MKSYGFSLIELMIVVAIIGVIAAIVYPNYTRHVQDTRMSTAQGDLMALAQFMERQYSLNNAYNANVADSDDLPFSTSPRDGSAVAYTLNIDTLSATTYRLTATPTGPQAGHECGTLTLNHAGVRGADLTTCWR